MLCPAFLQIGEETRERERSGRPSGHGEGLLTFTGGQQSLHMWLYRRFGKDIACCFRVKIKPSPTVPDGARAKQGELLFNVVLAATLDPVGSRRIVGEPGSQISGSTV